MSSGELENAEGSDAPIVKKVYRTVTPGYRGHGDTEMSVLGLLYFGALLVLLVPLLPFLAVAWAVGKVLDALQGR